jgi:broad specificity phosphatase PhoE
MRIAALCRHGKKTNSNESTVWKQKSLLSEEGVAELKTIEAAYTRGRRWDAAFYSMGFARTEQTARILTRLAPTESAALSPLGLVSDNEWLRLSISEGKELTALETLAMFPDEMQSVGFHGANFITTHLRGSSDTQMLFVTHSPVAEAILATLLNQWPLKVPMTAFEQGDIVQLGFDNDMRIVQMKYLEAARAAKILEDEERRNQVGRDYLDMIEKR